MKVGDLVRPRSAVFRHQVGVVIAIGFMGGVGVRLIDGTIATYNETSLEILSAVQRPH